MVAASGLSYFLDYKSEGSFLTPHDLDDHETENLLIHLMFS